MPVSSIALFASIISLAIILLPRSSAAQQECIGIDNDIQRLQCFDNWADSQRVPTRGADEIFEEFFQLATFFGEIESDQPWVDRIDAVYSYSMNNCALISEAYSRELVTVNGEPGSEIRGELHTIDLGAVDLSQSRPFSSMGRAPFTSYEIVMYRGVNVKRQRLVAKYRSGEKEAIIREIDDLQGVMQDALLRQRDPLMIFGPVRYPHYTNYELVEDRTMRVPLTPGMFAEDSGPINELFVELVEACQRGG